MDSSGSLSPDHSWLAFSLSNQYYHHHHPSSTSTNTSTTISHQPQLQQQQHHQQHQHQHQHQHLSFFQQHPHLFFPPQQHVDDEVDGGASRSIATNNELPFLGTGGGGLLQVGLFPTSEAVTVASTGGGGVYDYEQKAIIAQHHHHQLLQQQQQQQQQVQEGERIVDGNNKQLAVVSHQPLAPSSTSRKVVEGFGQRTSIYRGVTRHRWTGRYEAHLWDNSCRREGQSRKGRQVYLGGYDKEEKAARAYDLAALKYWGPTTTTNFPITDYEKELEQMKDMSRQEFVASLRRKSSGFSRGASMYRGVTRHHQHGRWQARIGRVAGNKDLYLGTFSTQEEAAEAYDIAAIKFRGLNAVTNFDISRYDVKSIISSNLPVGGMSKNTKPTLDHEEIKPPEVIKPESLPLVMSPPSQPSTFANHNFVGVPIKPNLSLQNYNWPALESNQTPLDYGFGYVQQPGSIGGTNGATNGAMEEYNGYYEDGNNNDNGNDNNNVDDSREVDGAGSSSVSNSWIVTPNLHSLQSPKQNAPVLQTPIFGIE